jgi:uncharacterized protein YndB with AHSA1/START domain
VARNEIFISASPREVFELLSDPRTYEHWVPGSRLIRAADREWPAEGAAFDHTSGHGPLGAEDHTSVCAVLEPVMLELRANARPIGAANVTIYLQPEGNGTRVLMLEEPAIRALSLLIGPIGHGLMRLRNAEALRRLKDLAEGAAPRPEGPLPPRKEPAGQKSGRR